MLRIVSLTMVLLLSVGVILPLSSSSAHGLRQNLMAKRHYQHRRHSRAWWRRYRARMARLRLKRRHEAEMIARRRMTLVPVTPELLASNIHEPAPVSIPASIPVTAPIAVPVQVPLTVPATAASIPVRVPFTFSSDPVPVPRAGLRSAPVRILITAPPPAPFVARAAVAAAPASIPVKAPAIVSLPVSATAGPVTALTSVPRTSLAHATNPIPNTVFTPATKDGLPAGWNKLAATKNGEVKFRTETAAGVPNGVASLDVVAQSRPNPLYMSAREERRLLAGVAIADLRRIVIDKMISDGGWVTNDYFRDVAGQRVFIVTAQTPGDGRSPDKSWNFYFTEVNGRIYRLTTNTPQQFSDRMATEAESFIASFHAISKPANK